MSLSQPDTVRIATTGQYTGRGYQEHRGFWQGCAGEVEGPFNLSGALGLASLGNDVAAQELTLGSEAQAVLSQISKGAPLPEFVVIAAALTLALSTHLDHEHAVLRTPALTSAGALPADHETVSLVLPATRNGTVRDHLASVNTRITQAYRHQDWPVEALLADATGLSSDVVVVAPAIHAPLQSAGEAALLVEVVTNGSKTLRFSSPAATIPGSYLRALASLTEHLLCQFSDLQMPVDRLDLNADHEIARTITEGPAPTGTPKDTIISLFAETVSKHGQNAALVTTDETISYDALAERVCGVRNRLREMGVEPGDVVGLFVDRTPEWIVGLLGIMAQGAIYLPLDPEQPEARTADMLDQSRPRQLMAAGAVPAAFSDSVLQVGDIQPAKSDLSADGPSPDDLAYLLFTSGSTGKPKGVKIAHNGFTVMIRDQIRVIDIHPTDTFAQIASATFDASLYEIFNALLAGATLALIPAETLRATAELHATFERLGVTIALFTPRHLETLNGEPLPTLRALLTAGDVAPPALMQRYAKDCVVFNAYGPTECSICASIHRVEPTQGETGIVPIGKPVAGSLVNICDTLGRPLPPGLPGEIVVTGPGIARGYLGRDADAPPFGRDGKTGARSYATGDYGVYDARGDLVYLGRRDQQIKLRGYRVERGEIEAALATHPTVAQAFVPAPASGEPLVAYAVRAAAAARPGELRDWMAARLPDYMLPTEVIPLDRLPLTSSGKVDTAALPRPGTSDYVAPRDAMETAILAVWQSVLGTEQIGVTSDFFAVGGDSISAIQIASRLGADGIVTSARDILSEGTVESLAQTVTRTTATTAADQGRVTGPMPLLPAQNWFFSTFKHHRGHFNQAMRLRLQGRADRAAVEAALNALVEHHDALRTRFEPADAQPQIEIGDDAGSVIVTEIEPDHGDPEAALAVLQESMDPASGRNLAALLMRGKTADELVIAAHHMAVDWVSWGILVADFDRAYTAAVAGAPIAFDAKTASVVAWAQDVEEAREAIAQKARPFWNAMAARSAPALTSSDPGLYRDSESMAFALPSELAHAVNGPANEAYSTRPHELILTALIRALDLACSLGATAVLLEGHGREPVLSTRDVSRTVGWFTAVYPVVLASPPGDADNRIKTVKEVLRSVPDNGAGYLPLALAADADPALADLVPQVSFNFLGGGAAAAETSWTAVDAPVGPVVAGSQRRVCAIDVAVFAVGDEVTVTLTWNGNVMEEATMARLAREFEADLQHLCDHCQGLGQTELTASDVAMAGLSQDELEALLDE